MQLSLTGHHVDLTDSLRAYVDTKFERLERHFDHVTNVHVILGVEKLEQKDRAGVEVPGEEATFVAQIVVEKFIEGGHFKLQKHPEPRTKPCGDDRRRQPLERPQRGSHPKQHFCKS